MTSLNEIRERTENAPRLLVSKANEGGYDHPASVYEEEDGLETLCVMPSDYHPEWQDMGAQSIVDAFEDRDRLMAVFEALKDYGNAYIQRDLNEIIEETLENWKRRQH